MARQHGWMVAAILVAAIGSPAEARPETCEPGGQPQQQSQQARDGRRDGGHERRPWWKNPRDMAEIGLSSEQSATIDSIFRTEIEKMKPLRNEVTELERVLDATIRANTASVETVARQVETIERKRAELNKTRTVMLYRIRRVLNAEQNAKLQAMWDRQEAARKKQDADHRR